MRFGICTTPELVPALVRAGYDYAELPIVKSLQPEQPEREIMPRLIAQTREAAIEAEVWYLFLPGDLAIVGNHSDDARLDRYLHLACERVSRVGGQTIVFGSGGARRIPEGFSRAEARRQMVSALARAGQAAAPFGIMIGLEPLNQADCNHITSVPEAVDYVREAAHPSLGIVADLHHITQDGQPLEDVLAAKSLLVHAHVAGAGRRAPVADDIPFLAAFFAVLKRIDYTDRVSVEGRWDDLPAQAPETLAVLHHAWEAA